MTDITSLGVYYPSRMCLMKVMILGEKILSSNDEGAASHEIRHFIDLSTLIKLQGELKLSESLIPCYPVCRSMGGKGMNDQRVLGMLNISLSATVSLPNGDKLQIELDNVVVVDRLPVPLHISFKMLRRKVNAQANFGKVITAMYGALGELFGNDNGSHKNKLFFKFDSSQVPDFKDHPFWANDDDTIFLGYHDKMAECADKLESKTEHSRDTVRIPKCAVCNTTIKLKICMRCHKTYYCSVDHQRNDWKRHKLTCK